MPAQYDYRCKPCGKVQERTYPVGGAPQTLSDVCERCHLDVTMDRVYSAPNLKADGTYSYKAA